MCVISMESADSLWNNQSDADWFSITFHVACMTVVYSHRPHNIKLFLIHV